MTSLLARILLSIMTFPLAALVYIVVTFNLAQRGPDESAFLIAAIVTAVFVAGYWLWLWRGTVRWTSRRVTLTLCSGLLSIAMGTLTGLLMVSTTNINDPSFGIFIGGICAIVLWLPMTIVLWRETAEERAERIRQYAGDVLFCPQCGYNLTGLHEARCPECGAQFTLNQLYAAQHRDEIADAN